MLQGSRRGYFETSGRRSFRDRASGSQLAVRTLKQEIRAHCAEPDGRDGSASNPKSHPSRPALGEVFPCLVDPTAARSRRFGGLESAQGALGLPGLPWFEAHSTPFSSLSALIVRVAASETFQTVHLTRGARGADALSTKYTAVLSTVL